LWCFRQSFRFPQAFLLFPLGAVAIWLMNAVRIAALVAVGNWMTPEVATHGFHSQAGWVAFLAVALGLVFLTQSCRFFALTEIPAREQESRRQTPASYLLPLSAILATTMITTAFSSGFDALYPLRVPAAVAALWFCGWFGASWRWSWSWTAVGIGVAV